MATAQTVAGSAAASRRRAKQRRRPINMVVGAVVVAGLAWWGWNKAHPAPDPTANLITAKVTRGDLDQTVTATGSVTAQTGAEVKIGSQITGVIKHLYADVGTHVRANQEIAELDLPDIEAQKRQAIANLAAAQTRYEQVLSGVGMERTQTSQAVVQARANLNSAEAKLGEAQAAYNQQVTQTSTDIDRAQNAYNGAKAALSTAQSNLQQVQEGADLQVQTAQEQLKQAQANFNNSNVQYRRDVDLVKRGFVAQSVVDQAQAQNLVNQSQVDAAHQNVLLVQQRVRADLQSARDAVTQAEQSLAAAGAALRAARAERAQDRVKLAAVVDAKAQVGQVQAGVQTALGNRAQDVLKQQDVQAARDAVDTARQQLAYSEAQVAKTIIRSPISGTVLQLAAQQGETLAAGLSAPTLIIVADLNRLQVDVFVDETDIGKVHLGQDADIVVDAFPKHTFHGKVVKIASGSTIQQGVVTYDVTIAIRDRRMRLKPDMTANATIHTGKVSNVLLVPAEAVKLGTRGSTVDTLVIKDGKPDVQHTRVKTGASDGVNTQITEGLTEGETIVLAGGDNGRRGFGPQNPFGPQRSNGQGGRGGGGGGGGRRGG